VNEALDHNDRRDEQDRATLSTVSTANAPSSDHVAPGTTRSRTDVRRLRDCQAVVRDQDNAHAGRVKETIIRQNRPGHDHVARGFDDRNFFTQVTGMAEDHGTIQDCPRGNGMDDIRFRVAEF
jgi:hypothetical protein